MKRLLVIVGLLAGIGAQAADIAGIRAKGMEPSL
jgi:hypothetical protein